MNKTEGTTVNPLKKTDRIWGNSDHLEDNAVCE